MSDARLPGGEPATDVEVTRLLELMRDLGRLRSLRDPVGNCFHDTLGLTPPQIHAVMWIHDEHPMTMGVLARRLGITEKSVTGIVDRLEDAKIAARGRDPQDRRVVTVVLTEHGEELAKTFLAHVTHKVQELLDLLDRADREDLFRILGKIRDRAATAVTAKVPTEAA